VRRGEKRGEEGEEKKEEGRRWTRGSTWRRGEEERGRRKEERGEGNLYVYIRMRGLHIASHYIDHTAHDTRALHKHFYIYTYIHTYIHTYTCTLVCRVISLPLSVLSVLCPYFGGEARDTSPHS
jgi:hypothetical protein